MRLVLVFIISLVIVLLPLSACSAGVPSTTSKKTIESSPSTKQGESTEEYLLRLKAEAVKADWVELTHREPHADDFVYLEGEVTIIMIEGLLGYFYISQEENGGYGIYHIDNVDFDEPLFWDGDIVKVWGCFTGKEETTHIPTILGLIIEPIR